LVLLRKFITCKKCKSPLLALSPVSRSAKHLCQILCLFHCSGSNYEAVLALPVCVWGALFTHSYATLPPGAKQANTGLLPSPRGVNRVATLLLACYAPLFLLFTSSAPLRPGGSTEGLARTSQASVDLLRGRPYTVGLRSNGPNGPEGEQSKSKHKVRSMRARCEAQERRLSLLRLRYAPGQTWAKNERKACLQEKQGATLSPYGASQTWAKGANYAPGPCPGLRSKGRGKGRRSKGRRSKDRGLRGTSKGGQQRLARNEQGGQHRSK
jgi:hypothetical protein